jgi:hypothetical protein
MSSANTKIVIEFLNNHWQEELLGIVEQKADESPLWEAFGKLQPRQAGITIILNGLPSMKDNPELREELWNFFVRKRET